MEYKKYREYKIRRANATMTMDQLKVLLGDFTNTNNYSMYGNELYYLVLSGNLEYTGAGERPTITFKEAWADYLEWKGEQGAGYTVLISEMKPLYDVACSSWKPRIRVAIEKKRELFSESITFSKVEIDTMIEASDSGQLKVLYEIFPAAKVVDKNYFKEDIDGKLLRGVFGGKIQVADGAAHLIGRGDLSDRSLSVSSALEVILHTDGIGGTVIEFKYK